MCETYTIGGNDWVGLGGDNYSGQSFIPLKTHVLQYIDLELSRTSEEAGAAVWVYFSDAFHKPTGSPISEALGWLRPPSAYGTPERVRFTMKPRTLYVAIEYVIVVHSGSAFHPEDIKWQYDKDIASYPRGERTRSTDGGHTWHNFPTQDHIFAEFGYPPLVKVPYTSDMYYFAVCNLEQCDYSTSTCMRIHTTAPVTIYACVTLKEPVAVQKYRLVRGVRLRCLSHYVFIDWKSFKQKEKSDSLYHTFHIGGLEVDKRYWIAFIATCDEKPSPSVGPIFTRVHPGGPPFTYTRRPAAPGDLCSIPFQVGDPCPNHYLNVNESTPDEDTTCVIASGGEPNLWRRDLYHIPNLEPWDRPIKEVHLVARCRRIGGYAYAQCAKAICSTYGHLYENPEVIEMPETYENQHWHLLTNPFTGAPWTYQEVNDLQIGVAVQAYHGIGWMSIGRCTQLYCEIEHACEAYE